MASEHDIENSQNRPLGQPNSGYPWSAKGVQETASNGEAMADLIEMIDLTTDYIYEGQAKVGSSTDSSNWRIKRYAVGSNPILIKFADGVTTFSKVWDDRATYTY